MTRSTSQKHWEMKPEQCGHLPEYQPTGTRSGGSASHAGPGGKDRASSSKIKVPGKGEEHVDQAGLSSGVSTSAETSPGSGQCGIDDRSARPPGQSDPCRRIGRPVNFGRSAGAREFPWSMWRRKFRSNTLGPGDVPVSGAGRPRLVRKDQLSGEVLVSVLHLRGYGQAPTTCSSRSSTRSRSSPTQASASFRHQGTEEASPAKGHGGVLTTAARVGEFGFASGGAIDLTEG